MASLLSSSRLLLRTASPLFPSSLSVVTPQRNFNLHEYQSKSLLDQYVQLSLFLLLIFLGY
ncbi:MAG: hypothetical protein Q8P67_03780 [archaeon]|nr:hypothetical protein [archaeon]